MIQRFLFLILLTFSFSFSQAESNVTFSENVSKAKTAIYSFDVAEAKKWIAKEKADNPDNLYIHYLESAYRSVFELFTNVDYQPQFDHYLETKKKLADQVKRNYVESPHWYYILGEIHFQTAMVAAKKHHYYQAANHTRTALIYLKKNLKKYPNFYGNTKTLALIKETVSSLPSSYQKFVRIIGIDVSNLPGKEELQNLVYNRDKSPKDSSYYHEASYYLAMMDFYLQNDKQGAWEHVKRATNSYQTNLIQYFMRLNFALKCQKNDDALKMVDTKEEHLLQNHIPIIHYLIGLAKIQNLEDDALSYFTKYQEVEQSELKYPSYLYSYYAARLEGQKDAETFLRQLGKKKEAKTESGKNAKQTAQQYLKSKPELELIKSRLLYDGGYYSKALLALGDKKEKDYKSLSHRVEYNYRKGRIYEQLKRYDIAILFYKEVINEKEKSNLHYVSYSALYIAQISESKKQYDQAKIWFEKALKLAEGRAYSKSVEMKSKAGIKRIKKAKN